MDIIMNYLCDSLRKSFKLGMMVHAVTLHLGGWPSKIVDLARLCKKKGTSIATVDKVIAATRYAYMYKSYSFLLEDGLAPTLWGIAE